MTFQHWFPPSSFDCIPGAEPIEHSDNLSHRPCHCPQATTNATSTSLVASPPRRPRISSLCDIADPVNKHLKCDTVPQAWLGLASLTSSTSPFCSRRHPTIHPRR
ncbi:hypothetical protein JAAARDRAFT_524427 [Jaapia argillacea MUCL 33604]|uniref:Uncharacterized protein n=1 Tax=Jaapia argillacea MUCL 33604 TaxID=933084 RepID=A0A067Q4C4_9AGAM|nr:hypothetical protein JAAARDRAFT_524427 [Jaapia argillacea MUCL 33604]